MWRCHTRGHCVFGLSCGHRVPRTPHPVPSPFRGAAGADLGVPVPFFGGGLTRGSPSQQGGWG